MVLFTISEVSGSPFSKRPPSRISAAAMRSIAVLIAASVCSIAPRIFAISSGRLFARAGTNGDSFHATPSPSPRSVSASASENPAGTSNESRPRLSAISFSCSATPPGPRPGNRPVFSFTASAISRLRRTSISGHSRLPRSTSRSLRYSARASPVSR